MFLHLTVAPLTFLSTQYLNIFIESEVGEGKKKLKVSSFSTGQFNKGEKGKNNSSLPKSPILLSSLLLYVS